VRRYYRLAAPGAAFAAIGGLLLLLAPLPEFRLVGGYVTSGGYALALQVVLTLFLLTAIDDFQQPLPVDAPARGDRAVAVRSTMSTSDTRHALLHLYRRRPLAALFLAFGVATSLAALLIGWLDPNRSSEVALAAVLVVTALVQLPAPAWGLPGWCAGFATGSVLALAGFGDEDLEARVLGWLPLVVGLWALWGLVYGVTSLTRSRMARHKGHDMAAV
jgi:hypothetical protein